MDERIFIKMKLAGIWPNNDYSEVFDSPSVVDFSDSNPFGCDILPLLHAAWDTQTGRADRFAPASRPSYEWCNRSLADGCSLRFIGESCGPPAVLELLGSRLFWFPTGVPSRLLLGLASSRLGRGLDRKQAWFQSLRAICARCDEATEMLLTARGTAPARFVMRCQELFGVDVLEIVPAQCNDVGSWYRETILTEQPIPESTQQIYVSPPLDSDTRSPHDAIPVADRAIAALSERLIMMFLRRGGHWEKLIRWRSHESHWAPGQTMLALGNGLVEAPLRDELLDAGTIGWTILGAQNQNDGLSSNSQLDGHECVSPAPDWTYLTHCTRGRDGPWPDQADDVYMDDLILGRPDADRSPLAALKRIAQTERLIASSTSVSGTAPVVSFTEVTLEELHALRVFRAHRGHWDFEPYGICIRRDWLKDRNARRVGYAPREQWERLSSEERLFHQLDISRTKHGNEIDWTVEQEWRIIGDVLLGSLTNQDAFLFVPTAEEAAKLAHDCRWPVRVLKSLIAED
jgi:hypothetical protein